MKFYFQKAKERLALMGALGSGGLDISNAWQYEKIASKWVPLFRDFAAMFAGSNATPWLLSTSSATTSGATWDYFLIDLSSFESLEEKEQSRCASDFLFLFEFGASQIKKKAENHKKFHLAENSFGPFRCEDAKAVLSG